jgi:hypothetical protein
LFKGTPRAVPDNIFAKFLADHIFLQNRDKKYIKKFTKSAGSTWHGGLARGPSAQQAYLASGPLMGRSELIDGARPPRNDGPPKFDSPSAESWELSLCLIAALSTSIVTKIEGRRGERFVSGFILHW